MTKYSVFILLSLISTLGFAQNSAINFKEFKGEFMIEYSEHLTASGDMIYRKPVIYLGNQGLNKREQVIVFESSIGIELVKEKFDQGFIDSATFFRMTCLGCENSVFSRIESYGNEKMIAQDTYLNFEARIITIPLGKLKVLFRKGKKFEYKNVDTYYLYDIHFPNEVPEKIQGWDLYRKGIYPNETLYEKKEEKYFYYTAPFIVSTSKSENDKINIQIMDTFSVNKQVYRIEGVELINKKKKYYFELEDPRLENSLDSSLDEFMYPNKLTVDDVDLVREENKISFFLDQSFVGSEIRITIDHQNHAPVKQYNTKMFLDSLIQIDAVRNYKVLLTPEFGSLIDSTVMEQDIHSCALGNFNLCCNDSVRKCILILDSNLNHGANNYAKVTNPCVEYLEKISGIKHFGLDNKEYGLTGFCNDDLKKWMTWCAKNCKPKLNTELYYYHNCEIAGAYQLPKSDSMSFYLLKLDSVFFHDNNSIEVEKSNRYIEYIEKRTGIKRTGVDDIHLSPIYVFTEKDYKNWVNWCKDSCMVLPDEE